MNILKSRRTRLIAAVSVAGLLLGGGFAVSATAASPEEQEVPKEAAPTEDLIRGQDDVMTVADPLLALVNPTEGGERITADGLEYGYGGMIVDPERRTVDVYWSGDVEPKAKRILDSAAPGVTVRVHKSEHTLFELLHAVDLVIGMSDGDEKSAFTIVTAGPEADGSGVWVEYTGDAAAAAVKEAAEKRSGVAVVSAEPGSEISFTARWNGGAPFKGGAGYYIGDGICSTSFPVTSDATGAKLILTAEHCVTDYGSVPVSNDASTWGIAYTGSGYRHPEIDAALLKPTQQSLSSAIYYGTYSTANLRTVGVVGGNVKGASACTDGANSGVHCLYIDEANFSAIIEGQRYKGLVVGSLSSTNAATVVSGDSGGPVVYPISNGKMRAMGTILGGDVPTSCPPRRHLPPPGWPYPTCFKTSVWVGGVTISDVTGMTIVTG